MRRRSLLLGIASALTVPYALIGGRQVRAAGVDRATLARIRTDWKKFVPTDAEIATTLDPIARADAGWRQRLNPRAHAILFDEGTEPPFSSALDKEVRDGVYVCAACRLPLFTSAMKFDSGTGWPSFFTHIPGRLGTKTDFSLLWPRTEYHCIKCGGHQGHVFSDGPEPTGERWCNNGVALHFLSLSTA